MPSYPKFIANSMLGHVVRWLRLLGYDAVYHHVAEDWRLLKIARDEDRVLLTRDLGLYRRAKKQNIKAFFVEDPSIVKILALLSIKYGVKLDFDKNDTRCVQCNTILRYTTSLIDVAHKVSKEITLKYSEFWVCPSCGKVYWQGNHWNTINEILEKAKAEKLKILDKIRPTEKKIEWLSSGGV